MTRFGKLFGSVKQSGSIYRIYHLSEKNNFSFVNFNRLGAQYVFNAPREKKEDCVQASSALFCRELHMNQ